LRFVTVDQDEVGGAIRHFPRRKLVMTQPMDIPLYGKVRTREMFKEELVALWNDVIEQTGLEVQTYRKVENMEQKEGIFEVHTSKETYLSRQVILAIGRRGTPRKLGVPGEDMPKVTYGLREPEHFQNMDVMVVGGGDSALEAACALAEEPGNRVTLSYRRDQFQRPKENVRNRLSRLVELGQLETVFLSNVVSIGKSSVSLDCRGDMRELPNDQVFIFAGGELPTGFLKQIGVSVETKFGQA
jgi:thioredoxin reductase